jgi:hypothetical protein
VEFLRFLRQVIEHRGVAGEVRLTRSSGRHAGQTGDRELPGLIIGEPAPTMRTNDPASFVGGEGIPRRPAQRRR